MQFTRMLSEPEGGLRVIFMKDPVDDPEFLVQPVHGLTDGRQPAQAQADVA